MAGWLDFNYFDHISYCVFVRSLEESIHIGFFRLKTMYQQLGVHEAEFNRRWADLNPNNVFRADDARFGHNGIGYVEDLIGLKSDIHADIRLLEERLGINNVPNVINFREQNGF